MNEEEKDSFGISYKSKWFESQMVINAIGCILDDEEVNDFEMSFPIVRAVWDKIQELKIRRNDGRTTSLCR